MRIEKGHKRIGLIHSPLDYAVNQMRYQGYVDAMTDNRLPVEPRMIMETDYSMESSREAATRILSLPTRPTAVFCTDDYKAASVLHVAAQMHIRVPEDISVMGHNDYDICTISYPTLTTVHVPLHHLGRTAADLVVQSIATPDEPIKNILLPTRIVTRDSVSAPGGCHD